jgi:hypothetical protein
MDTKLEDKGFWSFPWVQFVRNFFMNGVLICYGFSQISELFAPFKYWLPNFTLWFCLAFCSRDINLCHTRQYFPIRQGCEGIYLRLHNSVNNVTGYGLDSWTSIPSIGRFVIRPKCGRHLNPQLSTDFVWTAFHQNIVTRCMKLVTYL